jgi:PAS domain S-box-containing protein
MPQVHYPFIDIAVHPAVRTHFAAGDAVVLFSRDMSDVLWANGAGARLFGHREIYDLLEAGPERGGVAFRQLAAAAGQLALPGDRRGFAMRITSGFRSAAVQAEVHLVVVGHENMVMFSAAAESGKAGLSTLLSGFDDPDTHMAVLGSDGTILVSSAGFAHLGVVPETARALIAAAARSADGLVKRPVPSASGYLPAAIGRLSDELYLLFCVETSIGRMDAPEDRQQESLAGIEIPAEFLHEPEAEEAAAESPEFEAAASESGLETGVEQVEQAPFQDDEADARAMEAAADEEDTGGLAALDGASIETVAAASSDVTRTEDAPAETPPPASELAADRAEASGQAPRTGLPDVDSPELAADMAESSDGGAAAPEEFDAALAERASPNEAEVPRVSAAEWVPDDPAVLDGAVTQSTTLPEAEDAARQDAPTELDADIAEAAGMGTETAALESALPVFAADRADDADPAADAPEEFEEAQAHAEEVGASEPEALPEPDATMLDHTPRRAAGEGFHFDKRARPVRFVWKLDAGGIFAEVSDEFARTVGPHSGDIVGQSFRDLAARFALDSEHQITGLLDRRDTWSGRTIKWPVEATDLVVPVDLAALPTYSRNREFDGFRGFGIIRVGDAETDPHAFGLTISPQPPAAADADETSPENDAAGPPADEFRGEVPALDIISNPLANFSDKIIQLEERRAKSVRDGLSASEQAALKEIARQLEPFGKRPNEDILKSTSSLLQTDEADEAGAEDRFEEALAHDGDAEIHATEGDEAAPGDAETGLDDQGVQDLFEDLGTGPGLTAYAIDQVPMAILIHAGDRLIEANSEFRRLTGYETIAELDRAGGLDALITRREGPDAGVYLVRADDTQVLVSARLQSVRYEGSSALMLALTPAAGTLAAVTAEPQIAGESDAARRLSALKVEVDELRSILETATDGVIVLDTEGRIRSMNRSAAALFNFDDNETQGKPFAMLFAHESQKSVQDYLAGLSGHGVASVLNDGREVIGREASGGFIPLFMTMGRMPGSNSYCAVIRDITQWKRSEEELRTAKRAAETANQHKSDFLARVSHEIRTPLNAIIGFSDMIANEHFGPAGHSRYVEYATDIGRSGRHVLDIVNDLLDISKIEAGEMDLEFAAVGINDCVSEAVSLVQPQANAQRVIIRTALSQSVPDVVADLRSIKQIALNILANAIRYTPSGGQIVVSTAYEPSGSVTLRIRDTGVGMSKAELDQAMKPFGQVASGTRQRGDGTGLGLPLTKAMTEANRATFAIHSAPNEGTLVEITFPPQRVLAD